MDNKDKDKDNSQRGNSLGRMTAEEASDHSLRFNNPNLRRLSDEEYDELYDKMYNQQGRKKPEDS